MADSSLLQLNQHQARHFLQRFKDAFALESYGFKSRFIFSEKFAFQFFNGQGAGQVALVELEDVRDLFEIVAVFFKVFLEVFQGLNIGIKAFLLRIGHKDHAVHAAQDQLAAGIVKHLAGNGIQMEAGAEAAHGAQVKGQEIEEER